MFPKKMSFGAESRSYWKDNTQVTKFHSCVKLFCFLREKKEAPTILTCSLTACSYLWHNRNRKRVNTNLFVYFNFQDGGDGRESHVRVLLFLFFIWRSSGLEKSPKLFGLQNRKQVLINKLKVLSTFWRTGACTSKCLVSPTSRQIKISYLTIRPQKTKCNK